MSDAYGSLFSGVGGLDLAVEQLTGATCAWHCEVDPHASAVLAHHWPGTDHLGRSAALRAIGNGVCPQQATAAYSALLETAEVAA